MTESTPATSNEDRNRKRKALLAGGLVLGLGAAVTLAAWSDSEFAFGEFNTGTFNIEGSVDGTEAAYNDSPTADGDELTFVLASENMAPGQTVYAPYWIRTDAPTTLNGNVWHSSVTATGALTPHLTYRMASNAATCNAEANFDWVSTSTAVSGTTPTRTNVELNHGADASTAGTPIQVCIEVTLADAPDAISALDTSEPTRVVWGWSAESIDG